MSKEFPTRNKQSPSINRGATIYRNHSDNVFSVAWSPGGKYIASGSRDKTVRVWDVATGKDYYIYRGHNKCVLSVACSPGDGAYIASGDTGGIVQVWEAFTGSTIVSYRGHTRFVRSVSWSSDGQYIASGGDYGDNTVQVWQAFSGKQIYTHDCQYRIFSVAWSPGYPASSFGLANRIASSSFDGSVQVWQVSPTDRIEHNLFSYHVHAGPVYALAWSPDGAQIVSGGHDATLRIWNVTGDSSLGVTGSTACIFSGHTRPIKAVAWSPGGNHIVSGGDDATVQIWEAATGTRVATYGGHASWVRALAWSPGGNYIVSASGNSLHIWPVIVEAA